MTDTDTKRKQKLMLAAAVVTVLLAVLVIWAATDPDVLKSPIDLHITVVHSDKTESTYDIRTIKTNLVEVLQDEQLLTGVYVDSDENYYTPEEYVAIVEASEATIEAAQAAKEAREESGSGEPDPPDPKPDPSIPDADDIRYRATWIDGEWIDNELGQYWLCYEDGTRVTASLDTVELEDEDEFKFVFYQSDSE